MGSYFALINDILNLLEFWAVSMGVNNVSIVRELVGNNIVLGVAFVINNTEGSNHEDYECSDGKGPGWDKGYSLAVEVVTDV